MERNIMVDAEDFWMALLLMFASASVSIIITLSIVMTPQKIVKQGWFESDGQVYRVIPADVVAKGEK